MPKKKDADNADYVDSRDGEEPVETVTVSTSAPNTYFFPTLGISVTASSLEEATEKALKLLSDNPSPNV